MVRVATLSTTVGRLPVQADLTLYAGDDIYFDVTVMTTTGAAADLSASTAQAQVRATPPSVEVLAQFEATIQANVIHLHMTNVESAKLANVSGAWDVQLDTAGIIETQARGAVNPGRGPREAPG